ncbi:high-affinity choline transporter 1-like protein, partial [Leptotrombidium deliense]
WLCIPFSLNHPAVKSMSMDIHDWFGVLPSRQIGQYLDCGLLLILGGVPWQVYFQRVLSTKTAFKAQILSYVAAFGCIIMAIPPMIIGAVGRVTAWNETDFTGPYPLDKNHQSLILPMVLQYLTPPFVQFVGLGAVSAAVMSSSDSSLLSASSMFARNVYKLMIRQNASEHEVVWVMRGAIVVVGCVATAMALTVQSIYGLWYLSSDLVYVILFPQLVCVVYCKKHCNTYGSLAAYIVGLFLRALGGEDIIGIPAIIKYPYYSETDGQLFPFRTFAMLSSFATLLGVSTLSIWLFESGTLPPNFDIFHCVVNIPEDIIKVQEPQEGELSTLNTSVPKTYLASEMNGRVNPALVTDEDSFVDGGKSGAYTSNPVRSANEIKAEKSSLLSNKDGTVTVTRL